ncbi:hypothetical protein L7F22_016727, partial [Adiantum nelumboides]|nr:hypothetical protein [Adiantum nelumboides]
MQTVVGGVGGEVGEEDTLLDLWTSIGGGDISWLWRPTYPSATLSSLATTSSSLIASDK